MIKLYKSNWTMRCSPITTAELEVSAVGIFEMVLSISGFFWLAYLGYLEILLVSSLLAPLSLLRSSKSALYAIRHMERVDVTKKSWVHSISDDLSEKATKIRNKLVYSLFLRISILVVGASLVTYIVILRVITTGKFLIREPKLTLSSISKNWWSVVACKDIFHPPELLPDYLFFKITGRTSIYQTKDIYEPYELLLNASNSSPLVRSSGLGIFRILFPALLTAATAFLATVYRIYIKGISILYFPLIWMIVSSGQEDYWLKIRSTCNINYAFAQRVVAVFIALFIASKFLFIGVWHEVISKLEIYIGHSPLIIEIISPSTFPRWQIASFVNAFIAWILYFVCDRLWKLNPHGDISLLWKIVLKTLWTISIILSIYTIGVLGFTLYSGEFNTPPISKCWLPWCTE